MAERINSKRKGDIGERQLAQQAREHLCAPNAMRGSQRSGKELSDVVECLPGFHHEVKWHNKIGACRFMDQAERDAATKGLGEIPVVFLRENGRKNFLVMFSIEHAMAFAQALAANSGRPVYPAGGDDD